jgi:hypothetical protein
MNAYDASHHMQNITVTGDDAYITICRSVAYSDSNQVNEMIPIRQGHLTDHLIRNIHWFCETYGKSLLQLQKSIYVLCFQMHSVHFSNIFHQDSF